MLSVKLLSRGRYAIRRESDGAGDSGPMLVPVDLDTGKEGESGLIEVGKSIKCGSYFARSYSYQDWWMTTPVTAIYDYEEDAVEGTSSCKVKTGNSVYTCRGF